VCVCVRAPSEVCHGVTPLNWFLEVPGSNSSGDALPRESCGFPQAVQVVVG
jgi:hypothetical protein